MAVVHLDPWTDIVNVNWPSAATHVAFLIDAFVSGSAPDNSSYLTFGVSDGIPYLQYLQFDAILTTSRWVRKPVGESHQWFVSSSADVAVSGFSQTSTIVIGGSTVIYNSVKQFSDVWGVHKKYAPDGGPLYPSATGSEVLAGFSPCRPDGGTTITVPVNTGENFSSLTSVGMRFFSWPWTGATFDTTALEETFLTASGVLSGVGVTYKGVSCSIVGTWTPLRQATSWTALAAGPKDVPIKLCVLASIPAP